MTVEEQIEYIKGNYMEPLSGEASSEVIASLERLKKIDELNESNFNTLKDALGSFNADY